QGHSENWRLERMSRVDCNILRMAVFEIAYCTDIPPRVAINEAIDLGKRFGSEESGAFINGILDAIFLERYGPMSPEEIENPNP
ncbi:MAG: transcription antitermination factor NusB, partial [Pseudomonadota bacterium]